MLSSLWVPVDAQWSTDVKFGNGSMIRVRLLGDLNDVGAFVSLHTEDSLQQIISGFVLSTPPVLFQSSRSRVRLEARLARHLNLAQDAQDAQEVWLEMVPLSEAGPADDREIA